MQREILKRKQDKYAITYPINSSNLKENRSMLSQPGKIFTSGQYFHTLSRVLLLLCHWALGRAAFPIDSPPPPAAALVPLCHGCISQHVRQNQKPDLATMSAHFLRLCYLADSVFDCDVTHRIEFISPLTGRPSVHAGLPLAHQ